MAASIAELRDEAARHVERGKLDKAAQVYAQLEAREPASPQWPKRLAETLRRLGDTAGAIAAFERAADKFVGEGFLVQAIAMCKLVLQLDATRIAVVTKLAELTERNAKKSGRIQKITPAPVSAPAITVSVPELDSHIPGRPLLNDDGTESGLIVLAIEEIQPIDDSDDAELAWPEEAEVIDADEARPVLSRSARLALVTTPLFARLPPKALEQIIAHMALVHVAPDAYVFHEGDPGAGLYVISEGVVAVESNGAELARLGPGAFFGEISLVTDLPRSATVRAVERVEVLAIDRDLIRQACAAQPAVIEVLLGFVRDRLVDRVTRTSELFRPFGPSERAQLSSKFEVVEVAANTPLVVQGHKADGLYVILAGEAAVTRESSLEPIAILRSGDVFGEMSLLSGLGATAHVRASSRLLALRMPASTFSEVMMTHPHVLAHVSDLADQRARRAPAENGLDVLDLHLDLV